MSKVRAQYIGEEVANSIAHGVAVLLAAAATPILLMRAVEQNASASMLVGVSLFCAALILLYSASTLCHALTHKTAKYVFEVLDHCAIFILIAGTYSPILLGVLQGPISLKLLGIVWSMAVVGVVFKSVYGPKRFPALSNIMYLAMGWLIVFAIRPLAEAMPSVAMQWLVAGGIAYSFGLVFFVLDSRFRFAHFIWHLFVVAGSACHVVTVYLSL